MIYHHMQVYIHSVGKHWLSISLIIRLTLTCFQSNGFLSYVFYPEPIYWLISRWFHHWKKGGKVSMKSKWNGIIIKRIVERKKWVRKMRKRVAWEEERMVLNSFPSLKSLNDISVLCLSESFLLSCFKQFSVLKVNWYL